MGALACGHWCWQQEGRAMCAAFRQIFKTYARLLDDLGPFDEEVIFFEGAKDSSGH